jgi:hypothetical protein
MDHTVGHTTHHRCMQDPMTMIISIDSIQNDRAGGVDIFMCINMNIQYTFYEIFPLRMSSSEFSPARGGGAHCIQPSSCVLSSGTTDDPFTIRTVAPLVLVALPLSANLLLLLSV